MDQNYKDFLFKRHILVNDVNFTMSDTDCVRVAMTLAGTFAIRITEGLRYANLEMVRDAKRNLGYYVPEAFYCGFPDSVREMTPNELFCDQMLHYTQTYGLGWWEEPGHSALEKFAGNGVSGDDYFLRNAFEEGASPKDFRIVPEQEALELLKEAIRGLIGMSRPMNSNDLLIVSLGYTDFGKEIIPDKIPCKQTAISLLYRTKDLTFARFLKLSDVIKLLAFIQYHGYGSENLKKLNLRNEDRKLITRVINAILHAEDDRCDYGECFEKRKIWCGLLHHIHYRTDIPMMAHFMADIRNGKNFSAYHYFEEYMRKERYQAAANVLQRVKGNSDLIRHLNYILSRCETDEEIEEVFSCLH